jgi:VCBS repeat-containing protein
LAYAQITYSDATFRPEDWAITEVELNAGEVWYSFLDSAGNPAGELLLDTFEPDPLPEYSVAVAYVRNVAFTYDPARQGAVSTLSMAIDVRVQEGQSLDFGLWQGGVFYKAYVGDTQPGSEWTHIERLLQATDFSKEGSHPDFSAAGAPIAFGFLVANGAGSKGSASYDNFSVTVATETAVNQAPVANPDAALTGEHQPVVIDVLANDTDADASDSLTLVSATVPLAPGPVPVTSAPATLGTVAIVDNQIVFDPGLAFDRLASGAQETVAVSYTVADASGAQASSQALVTVVGQNDAPRLDGVLTGSLVEDAVAVPSYTGGRSYSVPTSGATLDVDAADLNRDGRIDLVVAGPSGFVTMMNNGSTAGVPNLAVTAVASSGRVDGLDLADINGDGAADVVMANSSSRTVSVAMNNGMGSFGPRQTIALVSSTPTDVTVADFNADGFVDLATSNAMGGFTVLVNNRMGGFVQQRTYGGYASGGITSGDVNGDGRIDVVLAEGREGTVGVWLNDGTGNFFTRSTVQTYQRDVSSVALGDANYDGRLDLAIGDGEDTYATVMTHNGIGFTAPREVQLEAVSGIALVDLSGDGRADVVGANAYGANVLVRFGASAPAATGQLTVTDVDVGDTRAFSVQGSSLGKYGAFSVDAAGRWTYALDNASPAVQGLAQGQVATELFTVLVTDGSGATDQRTVSIQVTGQNDAPVVLGGDFLGAIQEAASPGGYLVDSGSFSFSDADLADVHGVSVTPGQFSYGMLTAGVTLDTTGRGTGGTVTWQYKLAADTLLVDQLREGQVRTETFTLNLQDGRGGVAPRTVNVTITGTNDAPVAMADYLSGQEDTQLVLAPGALLANDSDVDQGDTRTIVSVQDANLGTVALENGAVVFTPDADFMGVASFRYTMADAAGATSTATANVFFAPVNDAPVAADDAFALQEDTSIVLTSEMLLANDRDVDLGDTATLLSVQDARHGSVVLEGGRVLFAPDADYEGTEAGFSYTMADAAGVTSTANVSFDVAAVNDAPVVVQPVAAPFATMQDHIFSFSFAGTFADIDGDALAYSATLADGSALPTWLAVDGANQRLVGSADGTQDLVDLRVTARDPHGASVSQDMQITVGRSLQGSNGPDVLVGARGNDLIAGANGADRLDGGAGDDRLAGGRGGDVMTSGSGRDVFVLEADSGRDTVTDFAVGVDRLELAGAGFQGLRFVDANRDGTLEAEVQLSGGTVVLLGVSSLADPALLFA